MADANRGDLMLEGRVLAGFELLGRSGVQSVELAFDDDRDDETAPVLWHCGGNWSGTRVFSEHFPYPAQAVEDLLTRVINGGTCGRCRATTVIAVAADGFCCFQLTAGDLDDPSTYRYVRTCEVSGG